MYKSSKIYITAELAFIFFGWWGGCHFCLFYKTKPNQVKKEKTKKWGKQREKAQGKKTV